MNDRVVARKNAIDHQPAKTRNGEHRLDHSNSAQQVAEDKTNHRPGRPERVLEGVAPKDCALRKPLGPCMGDVVEPQHFQRRGARHADQHTHLMDDKRHDGQDEIKQATDDIIADRHVAQDRQPAELEAEEKKQQ